MFSKKFFSQIVNTVSMVTAAYFAGSAAYLFCCVPGIRSIVIFIQLIGIMFTFIMWYCLREWLNESALYDNVLPGRMFILFSGAEHRTSLVCPLKKN